MKRELEKQGLLLAMAVGLLVGAGCSDVCGEDQCMFSESEWQVVKSLSPLPEPAPDPTNKWEDNASAIALGKMLFFEKRYSKAIKVAGHAGKVGDEKMVACTTCHDPNGAFSDTRSMPNNMSLAVSWTTRNTPSLVNTVYYGHVHGWDLRQDSLWNQGSLTPETGTNSAGDRCDYARMLWTFYRDRYNALFPEPLPPELNPMDPNAARFPATCRPNAATPGNWEKMAAPEKLIINRIMSNQGKAVAAYEAKLISRNAPFDKYVAGDREALSLQQKRGLQLFVGKAACVDCHSGPFFSDLSAHNLGVPQLGANVPAEDVGYFGGISQLKANTFRADGAFSDNPAAGAERNAWLADRVPLETDKGKFRTQTLRNVTQTAPYMHTGGFDSLRKVVEFYNLGYSAGGFVGVKDPKIKPLMLTEPEIDDLVSFLTSLTGEALPADLTSQPELPAAIPVDPAP